jgi:hypothetical protein
MIKLLSGCLDMNNSVDEETSIKNGETIKEEAKKGEIFLLWKQKSSERMIFLSVIKEIEDYGFTGEQFRIDTENKNFHQRGDMRFSNMNLESFDVYVLNKGEAQPYLNGLIVAGLQG